MGKSVLTLFVILLIKSNAFSQCTAGAGCDFIYSTCANLGATTVTSGSAANYNVYCIAPPAGCGVITVGDFVLDQFSTVRICTSSPTDTVKFVGQFRASGGGSSAANDNTRRLEVLGNVQMTFGGTVTFNERIVINIAATGTLDLRPFPLINPLLMGNSDSIMNAGKIVCNGPISFSGPVSNSGTIAATNITVSNGIKNNGTMSSSGNVTLSSGANLVNNGTVTSVGSFTSSAGSFFDNNNYWFSNGNSTFSGSYNNNSYFLTNGTLTLNASGTLDIKGGIFEADTLILNSGSLTTGTGCAVFKINKYSSIQSAGATASPSGSVGIWDTGNPGQIDNVACGCGSSDADALDNAITMPSGTQCSTPAAPNSSGPYCGIIPITSLSAAGGCFTTLPVSWLSVSATKYSENLTVVNWSVEETAANTGYTIMFSKDGVLFDAIGNIAPDKGAIGNYSYTHFYQSAYGGYYKIKQTDKDGKLSYSQTVYADAVSESDIFLYPNPASTQLFIHANQDVSQVEITSLGGTTVYSHNGEHAEIDISKLDTGIYFVKAYTNNRIVYSRFVKN